MALTGRTQKLLAEALGDKAAAKDVRANIVAATGGTGTAPSVSTVTTSSDITCGGHLKLASGKVVKINNTQVVGAQQAAPANVAVTFTANTPTTYGTPAGTLTVSDGATPTVVELVKYCNELRGVIAGILTVLHTHGLTT